MPSLMQSLGQMLGLQGLDLHFYEGHVGNHVLSEAFIKGIGCCKNLTWLDMSLWGLNEHQVGTTISLSAVWSMHCM